MAELGSEADKPSVGASDEPAIPKPEGSIPIEEIAEPKLHAHVRYAYIDQSGEFKQENILRSVAQQIPDRARYVSTGVYFLTHEQEDRLHEEAHPKVIQNECESDGRVAYSIVAETDDFGKKNLTVAKCRDALAEFIEEWIGIDEYRLSYSGRRSIHLDTGLYVTDAGRKRLKELAKEFNEQSEVQLDTSIYDPKSQYRNKGAEHRKTGLYKREIDPDDTRATIIRRANEPVEKETFHDLPRPEEHTEGNLSSSQTIQRYSHYSLPKQGNSNHNNDYYAGDSNREAIPDEFEGQLIRRYLKDQTGEDENTESYHRSIDQKHPFSPYAKTGDEKGRSVIVAKQIDGLLCRIDNRDRVYVPARIEYAIGGGDGSFERYNSESLIRLTQRDYAKWTSEPGDWVVIIGGRSYSARILPVDKRTAGRAYGKLDRKGRAAALEFLDEKGYDVGERGYHGDRSTEEGVSEETDAAKIKRRIDKGEPEAKSYENIARVACRLLKIKGWGTAWDWIEQTFGSEFDPEETYEYLKTFAEYYDDYHVDVPESVQEAKQR